MDRNMYIQHNTDIDELTAWVAENIDEGYLIPSKGSFGCSCDSENIRVYYLEIWSDDDYEGGFYVSQSMDKEGHKEVIELFLKYDLTKIGVYHCPDCGDWAIDGDW